MNVTFKIGKLSTDTSTHDVGELYVDSSTGETRYQKSTSQYVKITDLSFTTSSIEGGVITSSRQNNA